MRLFLVALCVTVCSTVRLDNTYLPPGNTRIAGGSSHFLSTPRNGPSFNHKSRSGFGSGFGPTSGFGKNSGFGAGFGKATGFGGRSGLNRPFPAAPVVPVGHGNYISGFDFGGRATGQQIPIFKFNNQNFGDGSYRYEYETGNSIKAQETGQQKQSTHGATNDVRGDFSYTGDDGKQYSISYIADENGFQPQGAHLPTPPPIPDAILKSLQQNSAAENDRGSYYNNGLRTGYTGNRNSGTTFGGVHGYKNGFGNIASRQYLAPRKPSFNSNTGYNY